MAADKCSVRPRRARLSLALNSVHWRVKSVSAAHSTCGSLRGSATLAPDRLRIMPSLIQLLPGDGMNIQTKRMR